MAFSRKYVTFLHVTTLIPGRSDDDLLGRVGGSGFPTLLVLDAEGEVVARPQERTVHAFELAIAAGLDRLAERAALAQRKGEGGATLHDLGRDFLTSLGLARELDPEVWMPRYVAVRDGLSAEERRQVERRLTEAQLGRYTMPTLQLDLDTKEGRDAALQLFSARRKLDELPNGAFGNRVVLGMLRWAEHVKDPILFESLLAELRSVRVGLADGGFMAHNEKRLEHLWKGLPPPERVLPQRR